MIEYNPPGCTTDDWFDLAYLLVRYRSEHCGFKYIIDSLALGASANTQYLLDRALQLPPGLRMPVLALLATRSSYPVATSTMAATAVQIQGAQHWIKFKLLMALFEQQDECTCNALKDAFLRTNGFTAFNFEE